MYQYRVLIKQGIRIRMIFAPVKLRTAPHSVAREGKTTGYEPTGENR